MTQNAWYQRWDHYPLTLWHWGFALLQLKGIFTTTYLFSCDTANVYTCKHCHLLMLYQHTVCCMVSWVFMVSFFVELKPTIFIPHSWRTRRPWPGACRCTGTQWASDPSRSLTPSSWLSTSSSRPASWNSPPRVGLQQPRKLEKLYFWETLQNLLFSKSFYLSKILARKLLFVRELMILEWPSSGKHPHTHALSIAG